MINVLGSSQAFLPNADFANRRERSFRCSLAEEGSFSGLPAWCIGLGVLGKELDAASVSCD